MFDARGTDSAKVIEVIETKAMRGAGTIENPFRVVTQYWNLKGILLAENDEIAMKAVSAEGLKFEEIKDNITISNSEDEVVAVIANSEIILKKGYKVSFDVGVNESENE